MNCKFCGKNIEENVKFCPYCGNRLIEEEENTQKKDIEEAFKETNELNTITKVLFVICGVVMIISFIPQNIIIPYIGCTLSIILLLVNVIMFIIKKSKYSILLGILSFVLLLTNVNSIVLYLILK